VAARSERSEQPVPPGDDELRCLGHALVHP
jgi:hypothetical protein